MTEMRNLKAAYLLGAALALSAAVFAFQGARKLYLNGQVASSDVRILDGKAFVPVSDVAKAMGLTIKERGTDFDLVKEDGSSPVANTAASKLAGEIPSGQWPFQVLSAAKASHFDVKLSKFIYARSIDAKAGFELVILNCRVKNGGAQKEELVLGPWEGNNTALIDSQDQTYEPLLYDVVETEGAPTGVSFLPGASINFTLVFQVPVGTEPRDLIFTAMRYASRSKDDQEKEKPTDIRVSLKAMKP